MSSSFKRKSYTHDHIVMTTYKPSYLGPGEPGADPGSASGLGRSRAGQPTAGMRSRAIDIIVYAS
jgi:hypothetical protein